MTQKFTYDVFLSHSAADQAVVLPLVQRLERDGLRVWYFERETRDSCGLTLAQINAGLMASRLVAVTLSANGMGSPYVEMELASVLIPDPSNKNGNLVLLRLDDAEIPPILRGFGYLDYRQKSDAQYSRVLHALRPKTTDHLQRASIARVYDYFLGGGMTTSADREVGEEMKRLYPRIVDVMVSNRAFLRRAVYFLAQHGVKQFLDIGAGLPTTGNTHEIAQQIHCDARTVYVDNDRQVVNAALRDGKIQPDRNVRVVLGDLTYPDSILSAQELKLIDFRQPVGLLMVAVLHFVEDDDTARRCVTMLTEKLTPGSYIVISHASWSDASVATIASDLRMIRQRYRDLVAPITARQPDEVGTLFVGATLVPPGLVYTPVWHPEIRVPPSSSEQSPFGSEPHLSLAVAGVGLLGQR